MIQLVTRADDTAGSFSANAAVEQCYHEGVVRNTSVMGVGDALQDAAARFAHLPGLAIGLHVSLNSEWTAPRYRPVLGPEQVPTLVDAEGCFWPSPQDLHDRGFSVAEAIAEVAAQLARIRAFGLKPSYLDEHMGVGWLPGLGEELAALVEREGLTLARTDAANLPQVEPVAGESRAANWARRIEAAPPGRYVLVSHPLFDDEESRGIFRASDPPGAVAADRNLDRLAWLDPALRALEAAGRVRFVRYGEY